MKEVQENDGFEEYMSVRSEDQHLKIMVQEVDHSIKNLLIFSDEKWGNCIYTSKNQLFN